MPRSRSVRKSAPSIRGTTNDSSFRSCSLAIAASLAKAGAGAIGLHDVSSGMTEALSGRLREHYPDLEVTTGSNDPAGFDVVVNGTPMGMNDGDPLPMDVVTYHHGAGPSQNSTQVYIIDVIGGHCGATPSPSWNDVTDITYSSGTIGRWISRGRF